MHCKQELLPPIPLLLSWYTILSWQHSLESCSCIPIKLPFAHTNAYYFSLFFTQCQFGILWIANVLPLVLTVHLWIILEVKIFLAFAIFFYTCWVHTWLVVPIVYPLHRMKYYRKKIKLLLTRLLMSVFVLVVDITYRSCSSARSLCFKLLICKYSMIGYC